VRVGRHHGAAHAVAIGVDLHRRAAVGEELRVHSGGSRACISFIRHTVVVTVIQLAQEGHGGEAGQGGGVQARGSGALGNAEKALVLDVMLVVGGRRA